MAASGLAVADEGNNEVAKEKELERRLKPAPDLILIGLEATDERSGDVGALGSVLCGDEDDADGLEGDDASLLRMTRTWGCSSG